MTNLKPIVPGCLALTYNCRFPENNGKIVKVIRYVGEASGWAKGCKFWETDATVICNRHGEKGSFFSEYSLMRIDGYEEDKDITEIAKELIHD